MFGSFLLCSGGVVFVFSSLSCNEHFLQVYKFPSSSMLQNFKLIFILKFLPLCNVLPALRQQPDSVMPVTSCPCQAGWSFVGAKKAFQLSKVNIMFFLQSEMGLQHFYKVEDLFTRSKNAASSRMHNVKHEEMSNRLITVTAMSHKTNYLLLLPCFSCVQGIT